MNFVKVDYKNFESFINIYEEDGLLNALEAAYIEGYQKAFQDFKLQLDAVDPSQDRNDRWQADFAK